MTTRVLVLAAYFAAVMVIGLLVRRREEAGESGYFLAGRSLKWFVLLATMTATNFSAFTVFGASGAGYRDGLSFYPIMGFGTGFMAVALWLVGRRAWQLGKQHGFVTPAQLVGHIYGDNRVSVLFALVLIVFTVPYLALQPVAAGHVFSKLFNCPQWVGAVAVTAILLVYTLRGGLRAVAWTDVLQGVLMLVLMGGALVIVTGELGGLSNAFHSLRSSLAELLSRPGGEGTYTLAVWFGFLLLWVFCDPMFPQLFQRFFAAKDSRALSRTVLAYPLVCTVVFALPVLLGLFGTQLIPGLQGKEADEIVPLLMTTFAGNTMGTLVLAAGLAALMSTMDSQLLTLSSIFKVDLYSRIRPNSGGKLSARLFVIGLAMAGLAVALVADSSVLSLGLTAFTGLAALFPTVVFGLYLREPHAPSALSSIVAGEAVAFCYHFKLLPTFGLLPATPVIVVSLAAYLIVQAVCSAMNTRRRTCNTEKQEGLRQGEPNESETAIAHGAPSRIPESCEGARRRERGPCVALRIRISSALLGLRTNLSRRDLLFLALFAIVFAAAHDFWQWDSTTPGPFGLPAWTLWFVALSAAQTVLMWLWMRGDRIGKLDERC
ncbi:MAG: sodium:solute symporter family protein [Planctomycetota bacterium]|nr:sodium:solute symporter family protein [Planctomycetota bacterium]